MAGLHSFEVTSTAIASKVVLITGANTGIGFQIVKSLCSSDQAYSIIVGGRSLSKAQYAISAVAKEFPSSHSKLYPIQVDMEQDESINRAFEEVQSTFGKLDALVSNAANGIMPSDNHPAHVQLDQQFAAGKLTERDMWNQSWNVNTTRTQIMTANFILLLLQSPTPCLLFITSGTSALAGTENLALPVNRNPPKGWPNGGFSVPAYRSAKCGMNMLMREWHRMLKEDAVKVWCIPPGFLQAFARATKKVHVSIILKWHHMTRTVGYSSLEAKAPLMDFRFISR